MGNVGDFSMNIPRDEDPYWDDIGQKLTKIYQCGACSGFHPELNRAHDCCSENFEGEMNKMPETTVWSGEVTATKEIKVPYDIKEIRKKEFEEGMEVLMGHIEGGGLSAVHYEGDESPTFVPSERITTKCPSCGELIVGFTNG